MDKEKLWKALRENKKVKADLAIVLALGVFLLIMSSQFFSLKDGNTPAVSAEEQQKREPLEEVYSEKELEKRLEEIFSKVEGAGEVKVMVVNSFTSEKVVAENVKTARDTTTERATQGDQRTIGNESIESAVVLLDKGDGSNAPLVSKEAAPKAEGIVIVAQGGDNVVVKDALSKAAQALLNVPAHKVEILKMK